MASATANFITPEPFFTGVTLELSEKEAKDLRRYLNLCGDPSSFRLDHPSLYDINHILEDILKGANQ